MLQVIVKMVSQCSKFYRKLYAGTPQHPVPSHGLDDAATTAMSTHLEKTLRCLLDICVSFVEPEPSWPGRQRSSSSVDLSRASLDTASFSFKVVPRHVIFSPLDGSGAAEALKVLLEVFNDIARAGLHRVSARSQSPKESEVLFSSLLSAPQRSLLHTVVTCIGDFTSGNGNAQDEFVAVGGVDQLTTYIGWPASPAVALAGSQPSSSSSSAGSVTASTARMVEDASALGPFCAEFDLQLRCVQVILELAATQARIADYLHSKLAFEHIAEFVAWVCNAERKRRERESGCGCVVPMCCSISSCLTCWQVALKFPKKAQRLRRLSIAEVRSRASSALTVSPTSPSVSTSSKHRSASTSLTPAAVRQRTAQSMHPQMLKGLERLKTEHRELKEDDLEHIADEMKAERAQFRQVSKGVYQDRTRGAKAPVDIPPLDPLDITQSPQRCGESQIFPPSLVLPQEDLCSPQLSHLFSSLWYTCMICDGFDKLVDPGSVATNPTQPAQ